MAHFALKKSQIHLFKRHKKKIVVEDTSVPTSVQLAEVEGLLDTLLEEGQGVAKNEEGEVVAKPARKSRKNKKIEE